jgi:hypothetical protein
MLLRENMLLNNIHEVSFKEKSAANREVWTLQLKRLNVDVDIL